MFLVIFDDMKIVNAKCLQSTNQGHWEFRFCNWETPPSSTKILVNSHCLFWGYSGSLCPHFMLAFVQLVFSQSSPNNWRQIIGDRAYQLNCNRAECVKFACASLFQQSHLTMHKNQFQFLVILDSLYELLVLLKTMFDFSRQFQNVSCSVAY